MGAARAANLGGVEQTKRQNSERGETSVSLLIKSAFIVQESSVFINQLTGAAANETLYVRVLGAGFTSFAPSAVRSSSPFFAA
jgi:hypothetical protein